MNAGVPNNQLPDASLTYALGGAANGKAGWYQRANLNFAPARLDRLGARQGGQLVHEADGQGKRASWRLCHVV